MPIVQKWLGWVARFLYNVEHGQVPAPVPVLEVGVDWPLEYTPIVTSYVTVAGSVVTTVLTTDDEHHALLVYLQLAAAAGIPVADVLTLAMTLRTGESVNPWSINGNNAIFTGISVVGGVAVQAGSNQVFGANPVYVPPGATLRIAHTSAAAGLAVTVRGEALVRPRHYPLRLP